MILSTPEFAGFVKLVQNLHYDLNYMNLGSHALFIDVSDIIVNHDTTKNYTARITTTKFGRIEKMELCIEEYTTEGEREDTFREFEIEDFQEPIREAAEDHLENILVALAFTSRLGIIRIDRTRSAFYNLFSNLEVPISLTYPEYDCDDNTNTHLKNKLGGSEMIDLTYPEWIIYNELRGKQNLPLENNEVMSRIIDNIIVEHEHHLFPVLNRIATDHVRQAAKNMNKFIIALQEASFLKARGLPPPSGFHNYYTWKVYREMINDGLADNIKYTSIEKFTELVNERKERIKASYEIQIDKDELAKSFGVYNLSEDLKNLLDKFHFETWIKIDIRALQNYCKILIKSGKTLDEFYKFINELNNKQNTRLYTEEPDTQEYSVIKLDKLCEKLQTENSKQV